MVAAALLATSILPVGVPVATAQVNLPALGDASDDFGVGAERRLGDRIMREVRRDPAYLDDPQLGEYLQTLWQPLVAAARRKGEITPDLDARLAWEAFLVRDRSVNAFALPGGFVGVHLGLIALTQTRDELASVLAHELTHVTQRHIARGFANSRRQSLIAVAGMILGLLAASRANSGDAASAAIAGSQAVAIQGELNFSRDMEREADRIGFALMSEAGFSPAGMAMMFERLGAASRLNDSGGFPYLRTHPLTVERIGEARARTGNPAPALRSGAMAPIDARNLAFEHAAAMARSRVMMDPREEALRRWQPVGAPAAASPSAAATGSAASGVAAGSAAPGVAAGPAAGGAEPGPTAGTGGPPPTSPGDPALERFAALLASAHASTLLRDWARADAALAQLRAGLAPSPRALPAASRALTLLAAESQIARGDGARAVELLAPLLEGDSRAVALLHAEALMAWSAAPAAALRQRAESLQTWAAAHPDDALAWQALGRLWARLDQPLRALRAEAENRYALGDLAGASDRLRAGQRVARQQPERARGEFIEASVIDARLREVDAQRRQIFLEERGGPLPP